MCSICNHRFSVFNTVTLRSDQIRSDQITDMGFFDCRYRLSRNPTLAQQVMTCTWK